jgi:type II secretory pathway predicted ATPase ExeA
MINLFYNFKTAPFKKDIKGEDIFISAAGRELFQRFEYMKQKRGIMLLTGMPGTGKNQTFLSPFKKQSH